MDCKKMFAAALVLAGLSWGQSEMVAQNGSTGSSDIEFAYDAGAEVVSAYLWRGQYLGGLSFQPDAEVGFNALGGDVTFRAGLWANIGASDWKFQKDLAELPGYNPNTYFVPELDVMLTATAYGASVGFTHYYYCDGTNFFAWKNATDNAMDDNSSSTEFWFGYNFDHFFGVGAYINWYTTIAGRDLLPETDLKKLANGQTHRNAFSTYIELGYDYDLSQTGIQWMDGITVGAQMGISPWESEEMYYNTRFAVVNLALSLHKEWELDICTLDLFAVGSLNPYQMNDKNGYCYMPDAFVSAAGDDKRYMQPLNGTIGLGVWF